MLVHEYLIKIKNIIWNVKILQKNDIMYLDIYNFICQNKKNKDLQSIMSNLQPNCCLRVDFQKVDHHTGGKWLIHITKRHKDNQLKIPCWIS